MNVDKILAVMVRSVWEWNQRKTGDDGWQKVNKSACRVNNDGREGTAATADSRAATRFLLAFLRCEDFCGCFADYAVDPDNDELDEGVLGEEDEAVDGGGNGGGSGAGPNPLEKGRPTVPCRYQGRIGRCRRKIQLS